MYTLNGYLRAVTVHSLSPPDTDVESNIALTCP